MSLAAHVKGITTDVSPGVKNPFVSPLAPIMVIISIPSGSEIVMFSNIEAQVFTVAPVGLTVALSEH